MKRDHFIQIEITSRSEWRQWLLTNALSHPPIWLITFKKPDLRHLAYNDIVEEALCFGWIDSLPRKLDEQRSMLMLAPRNSKSAWSKLNKNRIEALIAAGLMQPAGLKIVEAAKKTGSWDKLNDVEDLKIPPDLAAEFTANSAASLNFEAFPKSTKRAILEWILQAKKPETRAARITETVSKAEVNIRANQWRQ